MLEKLKEFFEVAEAIEKAQDRTRNGYYRFDAKLLAAMLFQGVFANQPLRTPEEKQAQEVADQEEISRLRDELTKSQTELKMAEAHLTRIQGAIVQTGRTGTS